MRRVAGLLTASTAAIAPACHPDACVWDIDRVTGEHAATATRDANTLVISRDASSAGATSSQPADGGPRSTQLSFGLTVAGDAVVDRLVLVTDLRTPPPLAPVTLDLAATDTRLRVLRDSVILVEAGPQGSLAIEHLDTRCEYSDAYLDSGAHWSCATDLRATVDATVESSATGRVRVIAQLAQDEALRETCHACGGIEGCDY